VERLVLSINASNVFNQRAYVDLMEATMPVTGIGTGRALYGRLITTSARVFF
jgi:outer membrane receptor protein involved in Fe transport